MSRIKNHKGQLTLKELAHSPYFSIINVHLVDINVFAKFYEIPSLPFQDIETPGGCEVCIMKASLLIYDIIIEPVHNKKPMKSRAPSRL